MSEELNERMKKNDNVVEDSTARQQLITSSIVRSKCLRCETSVTLMERVIVSGDVFHRCKLFANYVQINSLIVILMSINLIIGRVYVAVYVEFLYV